MVTYVDNLSLIATTRSWRELQEAANCDFVSADRLDDFSLSWAVSRDNWAALSNGAEEEYKRHWSCYFRYPIEIGEEAEHLKVVPDRGLTDSAYIKYMNEKAHKSSLNLVYSIPRVGGMSENKRKLLATEAEYTALYGDSLGGHSITDGEVH